MFIYWCFLTRNIKCGFRPKLSLEKGCICCAFTWSQLYPLHEAFARDKLLFSLFKFMCEDTFLLSEATHNQLHLLKLTTVAGEGLLSLQQVSERSERTLRTTIISNYSFRWVKIIRSSSSMFI